MEFLIPSLDTVIEIHQVVVAVFGGLDGIPHPQYIEAAIMRPQSYMAYEEDCDIYLVAAIILDAIARNHAFADGNKRTALITMLMTYNLNSKKKIGYSHHMNDKFEELVLSVAQNKPSIETTRTRLKKLLLEFEK